MRQPGPAIRSLARQLLEGEIGPQPSVDDLAAGAEAVCGKLAEQIEPLVGPTGFRVLLARSLHLVQPEVPLLEGITSKGGADAYLEGLGERVHGREPADVVDAITALLTTFLGLIGYFIGNELTVRFVSRAWPDLPAGTAGSAFEGEGR